MGGSVASASLLKLQQQQQQAAVPLQQQQPSTNAPQPPFNQVRLLSIVVLILHFLCNNGTVLVYDSVIQTTDFLSSFQTFRLPELLKISLVLSSYVC